MVTAGERERASGNGTGQVEKLWQLFDRVMTHSVAERACSGAAGKDLTVTQFDGLRFLARHPGCSIGEIAGGLVVSYPAATRLVSRLERRGLAARTSAQRDHRVVCVALTDLGIQAERSIRTKRTALCNKAMENLPASRRRALLASLERFLTAVLTDRRLIAAVCLRCGTDHDPSCFVNRAHIAVTGSPLSQF